jgi:hypothetical protein
VLCRISEDEQLSQKLQTSLIELDDGLHTALIRRGTGAGAASGVTAASGPSETDVSGVRSLSDELYYWNAEAKAGGGSGHAATRASLFAGQLKKIAAKFDYGGALKDSPYKEVVRLVEDTQDVFNEIYKQGEVKQYPQERMANNFEV